MQNHPNKKRVVGEGMAEVDTEKDISITPVDVLVQGFEEASTWYRENENSSSVNFPPNARAIAENLVQNGIHFNNLVGMILYDCAHTLVPTPFDPYSFSKFSLYVKMTYKKDSLPAEFLNLPPFLNTSEMPENKVVVTPTSPPTPKPGQAKIYRIAKLEGDLAFLEIHKNQKSASFTWTGSANLAIRAGSRCFGIIQGLKDDGYGDSISLTDRDLNKSTKCSGDIFSKGKNLITCAILDFDFLTTTIADQKKETPTADFRKSLKKFRDKINNKNKEVFQSLTNLKVKEFLEILFPTYIDTLS